MAETEHASGDAALKAPLGRAHAQCDAEAGTRLGDPSVAAMAGAIGA